MPDSMIVLMFVSLIAGATIRAWAFLVFAGFVALVSAVIAVVQTGAVGDAALLFLKLLLVMEFGYAIGLGIAGTARYLISRRKRVDAGKTGQVPSEPPAS